MKVYILIDTRVYDDYEKTIYKVFDTRKSAECELKRSDYLWDVYHRQRNSPSVPEHYRVPMPSSPEFLQMIEQDVIFYKFPLSEAH